MVEEMIFRPMRRFKQQLPEEDCVSILENAYRGFLSVVGDGGYPYCVPINFVYKDGASRGLGIQHPGPSSLQRSRL